MKPCHVNNGATIYVGRAATVHNPSQGFITIAFFNYSVGEQGFFQDSER